MASTSGRETCFVRRRNNSVPPIKTYLTSTTRRCSSPNCSCWDYSKNKSPIPQSISGNLLGHRGGGGGMEGGVSLSARGQFGINRVVGESVPDPNTPRHSLLLTRHASHVHARCDREQSVYSQGMIHEYYLECCCVLNAFLIDRKSLWKAE